MDVFRQPLPPLQADSACRAISLEDQGPGAYSTWVPILHVLLAESVRPEHGSVLQTCKVVAASLKPGFFNSTSSSSSSSQSTGSGGDSGQENSTIDSSSSRYTEGHAFLQQVLAALEDASLQLLLAGEQAGLDPKSEQQPRGTPGLTKKQLKQQQKREEKDREERAVLQMGLSWQALAALCHLFATVSYTPSDGWKAAAMRLGLGFATAPGCNSAVAVPAMLQLLLAVGVQPTQQQMAAAASRYLSHLTVPAGGVKASVLARATVGHRVPGAAAEVTISERESGRSAAGELRAADINGAAAGSAKETKSEQGASPARIAEVADGRTMDSEVKGGAAVEKLRTFLLRDVHWV